MLLGDMVCLTHKISDRLDSGEWPSEDFKVIMGKALTRNEDRQLFDLPLIEEPAEEAKTPSPDSGTGDGGG